MTPMRALSLAVVGGAAGALLTLWANGLADAQLWAALVALFGVLAAPYFAEWLRAHWFTAALKVEAEARTPWYVATPMRLGASPAEAVRSNMAHFYRVSVTNTGLAQAQHCEAVLEQVWFAHSGRWYRLDFWQPTPLHWSGDDRRAPERTINRGRTVFLDVGYVPTSSVLGKLDVPTDWPGAEGPRFLLDVLTHYYSQPSELGQGRYVLGVTVYASNAAARSQVWLSLTFEQSEFVVIERQGALGNGIPNVELTVTAGPPTDPTQVPTLADIARVQSNNFQRPVVLEE